MPSASRRLHRPVGKITELVLEEVERGQKLPWFRGNFALSSRRRVFWSDITRVTSDDADSSDGVILTELWQSVIV